jgi:hypothetical protein
MAPEIAGVVAPQNQRLNGAASGPRGYGPDVLAANSNLIVDEEEFLSVWMGVAPIPVVGLFLAIRLGEFVRLLVIFRKVKPPGLVLVIVPVVVVLVIFIVDPNLHGLRRRSSCHSDWGAECGRKE